MTSAATAYEQIRYAGKFYPQASPDRMATLAVLFGFDPAPVDHCRVLELGCGEGANVSTLAYSLPNSRFEGVDITASAIDRAREFASQIGVTNAEFRAEDLSQFPAERGQYDYIIAHGLYSWVPPAVRDRILDICSRHLAPNGLAYISYNALPGGYFRRYPRDITRFRIRSLTDPAERIREARAVLNSVLESMPENSVEATVLATEIRNNADSDGFFYHDLLADDSEPIYFLDFMDGATRHGLQFLAEADHKLLLPAILPESATRQMQQMPDRLDREQYMDFVRCRLFRQTILCRAGHELRLQPTPERLRRLLISGPTRPAVPIEDLHDNREVEFYTPFGSRVACAEAIPKALFCVLGEVWPRTVNYDDLKDEVYRRVGSVGETDSEAKFASAIFRCYASGLVNFHFFVPALCPQPSERPVASLVARLWPDLAHAVPSLNLSAVSMNDRMTALLLLLDGNRDRQQLVAELSKQFGQPVIPEEVERALVHIAECCLLIA